jgi:hypothetical protein
MKVAGTQIQCFLDACARVVKQREQRVVPLPFCCHAIRPSEDGSHFTWFQVGGGTLRGFLKGDLQHFGTLQGRKGLMTTNKDEEASEGSQAAVARGDGYSAAFLDVLKKGEHLLTIQVIQPEGGHFLVVAFRNKAQEQAPSISICQHGPMRRIALLGKPFVKKRVQQAV